MKRKKTGKKVNESALVPVGLDISAIEFMGRPGRVCKHLQKLKPKHLRIIAMHMQGFKGTEILEILKDAGIAFSLVKIYATLNDPLSIKLMKEFYAGAGNEIKALEGMAVDSLRKAMREGSHRDALNAADKVFKLNKRYGEQVHRDSAEDVISRAMEAVMSANETVREVVRQRPRLTDVTPVDVIENRTED